MNDVGVDLFEGCEGKIAGTQSGLEAAAVFEDVFAGVPVGEAEVEDSFAFDRRDAAWACAEGMDEPGEFGEGGDLEEFAARGTDSRKRRRATFATRSFCGGFGNGHRTISIEKTSRK